MSKPHTECVSGWTGAHPAAASHICTREGKTLLVRDGWELGYFPDDQRLLPRKHCDGCNCPDKAA